MFPSLPSHCSLKHPVAGGVKRRLIQSHVVFWCLLGSMSSFFGLPVSHHRFCWDRPSVVSNTRNKPMSRRPSWHDSNSSLVSFTKSWWFRFRRRFWKPEKTNKKLGIGKWYIYIYTWNFKRANISVPFMFTIKNDLFERSFLKRTDFSKSSTFAMSQYQKKWVMK